MVLEEVLALVWDLGAMDQVSLLVEHLVVVLVFQLTVVVILI